MTLSHRISLFSEVPVRSANGFSSSAAITIVLAGIVVGPVNLHIVPADVVVELKYIFIPSADSIGFPADNLIASEMTPTQLAEAPVSLADISILSAEDFNVLEKIVDAPAEDISPSGKGDKGQQIELIAPAKGFGLLGN